jgi:hypothetical protein
MSAVQLGCTESSTVQTGQLKRHVSHLKYWAYATVRNSAVHRSVVHLCQRYALQSSVVHTDQIYTHAYRLYTQISCKHSPTVHTVQLYINISYTHRSAVHTCHPMHTVQLYTHSSAVHTLFNCTHMPVVAIYQLHIQVRYDTMQLL